MWYIQGTGQPDPGKVTFQVSQGLDPLTTSSSTVSVGTWYHLVITYDLASQTLKMYINGALSSTESSFPSPNETSSNLLTVGADALGLYHFNGTIDDIRIYKRVLSAEEVSKLYTM